MPVAPASPKAPNVTGRQLGHGPRSGCPGLCFRSPEVKPEAMAGDYGRFQRALLRNLTARFSVAELVSTGGVAGVHGEWYDRIGARLDALPIDGRLYVSRFRLPRHPARYVWVDRHMRVWRADDSGWLRVSASLEPQRSV
jgi:hypothetical protein